MPTNYPEIPLVTWYDNSVKTETRNTQVEFGKNGVVARSRTSRLNETRATFSLSGVTKDRDTLRDFLLENKGKPFVFRPYADSYAGLFTCDSFNFRWKVWAEGNGVWEFSATFKEVFRPGWSAFPTASGNINILRFLIEGTGTVIERPVGAGNLQTAPLQVTAVTQIKNIGNGNLTLPPLTANGLGKLLKATGQGNLTIQDITTSGVGGYRNIGNASGSIPQLGMSGTGLLQTLDSDYDAFAARLTGSYTIFQLDAIQSFFLGLKADGVYNLLDFAYIHALANESDGRLNILNSNYTATNVNSMAHTAFQGFTSNGSSSYLNTNFNPATAGGNFNQNSGAMGIYTRNNVASDSVDMGNYNLASLRNTTIYSRLISDNAVGRINSPSFDAPSRFPGRTDGRRMLTISRTGSTQYSLYGNGGTLLQTTPNTSASIVSASIFIGTAHNEGVGPGGGFSPRQFAFSFISGGLAGSQVMAFTARVDTLLTALGAAV